MSNFREQLRQFFANTFKGWFIEVTHPTKYLLDCGLPDLPIVVRPVVLNEKIKQHGLTKNMLKNLPADINSPLLVFHSDKYTSGYNLIINKSNDEGLLCICLHPIKSGKLEINEIASVHGRRLSQIEYWANLGLLVSFDKKKIKTFIGSQFNSAKSERLLSVLDNAKVTNISETANKNIKKSLRGDDDLYHGTYQITDCENEGDISRAIEEVSNAGGIVDNVRSEYKDTDEEIDDYYESKEWFVDFHCNTQEQFDITCRKLGLSHNDRDRRIRLARAKAKALEIYSNLLKKQ